MKKLKKVKTKVDRRAKAHADIIANAKSADSKVQQRIETGGYRAPGSRNLRKAG